MQYITARFMSLLSAFLRAPVSFLTQRPFVDTDFEKLERFHCLVTGTTEPDLIQARASFNTRGCVKGEFCIVGTMDEINNLIRTLKLEQVGPIHKL